MDYRQHHRTLTFVPVLLITACFFFPHSSAADDALLDRICRKTSDVDFCRGVFTYDLRVPVADENGLLLIAISYATDHAGTTHDKILPLFQAAGSDNVEKRRLVGCLYVYKVMTIKFPDIYSAASRHDYSSVIDLTSYMANLAIGCNNVYRTGQPVKDCPIASDNDKVVKYAGVINTISQDLLTPA